MTLVRVLIGVIAALLKAFTGAFLAIFRTPLVALCALAVLGGLAFAVSSALGVGIFRRDR